MNWRKQTCPRCSGRFEKAKDKFICKDCGASYTKQQLVVNSYRNEGLTYYNEKDYENALYWFKKAAKYGDAQAQCDIGLLYDNGNGVKKSSKQAAKWYKKAAKLGNAQAQYNYAVCLENGDGVRKNAKKAASPPCHTM